MFLTPLIIRIIKEWSYKDRFNELPDVRVGLWSDPDAGRVDRKPHLDENVAEVPGSTLGRQDAALPRHELDRLEKSCSDKCHGPIEKVRALFFAKYY